MIYEIDESCLACLRTNDLNTIGFFEQLALDRRKCKNIIVAKREVLAELSNNNGLSVLSRAIYRYLEQRMSEFKLLLNTTSRHCRIVAKNYNKNIIEKNNHKIILINLFEAIDKDITGNTILLAENEDDIDFYLFVGKYYIINNNIGNVGLNYEKQHGGGSTIAPVLKRIIDERKRMCLCIVDSDRKYKNSNTGTTLKKIDEVINGITQDYFEVLPLDFHEIENIIPICILDKVVEKNSLEEKGLIFIKYLKSHYNVENSPIFYFDFKKGIPKKYFVLKEDADDKAKKEYNKKSEYRRYWENIICNYKVDLDDKDNLTLIPGICENLLRYSIDCIHEIEEKRDINSIVIDDYLIDIWDKIGELVYCWGCVGSRIAV